MIKKYICSILSFVFILQISATVFAQDTNLSEENMELSNSEFEEMILTLEEYISFEDNSIIIEDLPDEIENEFGQDVILAMQEGIETNNELAEQGEIIITDNGTIYEIDDDDFVVQGGQTKVIVYWWGKAKYMSTAVANNVAYSCSRVATTAAAISLITGVFCMPFSFGVGISGLYYGALSSSINYRNSGHNRGIIVKMTWALAYSTVRQ